MGGGNSGKKSRKRQRNKESSSSASSTTAAATAGTGDSSSSSVSFGWKKVNVHLDPKRAEKVDDDDDNDDMVNWHDNHYDDNDNDEHNDSVGKTTTSLSKRDASRDLPGHDKEGMAMFYGLEVIDGTAYTTIKRPDGSLHFNLIHKNSNNKKSRKDDAEEQERTKKSSSSSSTTDDSDAPKDDDAATAEAPKDEPAPANKKKKRKRKKGKNKSKKEAKDEEEETADTKQQEQKQENVENDLIRMQSSWTTQTAGVEFHRDSGICHYLLKHEFWTPTPIQAATLPAAILGRCNIVGAAPTGSGKTLAFVLPIVHYLLSTNAMGDDDVIDIHNDDSLLQALILTPTRELALQIATVCQELFCNRRKNSIVTLVGGLAHAKQIRILNAQPKPLICVATPGRLWELISSREHEHLNELSQLKFLVMDEADRMVQQASFPQLIHILDAVHQANPMHDESDDDEEEEDDDEEEDDGDDHHRMLGLPGIPGEAKVKMLNDDILKRLEQQQKQSTKSQDKDGDDEDGSGSDGSSNDDESNSSAMVPQVNEMEDEEFEQQMKAVAEYNPQDDEIALPLRPPVHRQTFIYSATLTLPSSTSNVQSFRRNNKGKRRGKGEDYANVDGAIAEILEKANAKGKTKVVDLTNMVRGAKHTKSVMVTGKNDQETTTTTNHSNTGKADTTKTNSIKKTASSSFRLPPGLELQQIKCTQRHKDSHLYGYLMTTKQGLSSGPCLVFCNSIAGVRRVGAMLQALGLHDVRILHAQMQQRARFKAVELLGRSNARTVVVATDVAARGLDIPSVASVVHYDAARSVDAFVHRSGRTARGVGPKAVGCSLSLVSPGEDKMHNSIVAALGVKFDDVLMDGRLLKEAQERTNLATKVVQANDLERKNKERSQWFEKQADDAGLEMDEDILREGEVTDRRDQNLLREAKSARRRLAVLLAQPMTTQRYGKFLSTNSAARQEVVSIPSISATAALTGNARKKRRRR